MSAIHGGSSPHTRGAPTTTGLPSAVARDHPRIRGEHHPHLRKARGARGIIPAYAGSTTASGASTMPSSGSSPHTRGAHHRSILRGERLWDHPRIRGEHVLGWGVRVAQPGIIPAYAGSTQGARARHIRAGGSSPHTRGALDPLRRVAHAEVDHPRIRGEHNTMDNYNYHVDGIIPAYAGSTTPRHALTAWECGSSPHTRGAPSITSARTTSSRDHPRIRGEHDRRGNRARA